MNSWDPEEAINRIKNMTREQFLETMKRAGIIDEDGNLTKIYTEVPEGWVSRADPSVYMDDYEKEYGKKGKL